MNAQRYCRSAALVCLATALLIAGCATSPTSAPPVPQGATASSQPPPGSVLRSSAVDPVVEARILALNPEHVTDADVRETLARGPTPRIILIHGGIYPVHLLMADFGRFLTGMGYPEERIRDPRDKEWSRSPYEPSARVAGLVAWYYEHDGMRPMIVGHSQGGIQAVKVLHDLNGDFGNGVYVWNPLNDSAENRTSIVDPFTGKERPALGLKLPYVSVVGAGGSSLLLPGWWNMIGEMQSIPDTVDDFVGFTVLLDPVALSGTAPVEYHHNGTANVRNVALPASYSHVFVPMTQDLAKDPKTRDWINAYTPSGGEARNAPLDLAQNALYAADVWYDVKKHWVLEAQRLINARKGTLPNTVTNRVK